MATVASLPPELLFIIFSVLDAGDLWVLAQVSRDLQSLAILTLLATHNLSASQIRSGVVRLPEEATFLLPRIHRIQPIRKLAILRGSLSLRTLTSILAATPRIPDVTICLSARGMEPRGVEEVASLIAPLSRALHPVMFVATRDGDGRVGLEAPRCGLPNPIHPSFGHCFGATFSAGGIIMGLIWIVPAVLVLCLLNLGLLVGWWCYGPYEINFSIAHHLEWTRGDSMKIQALSMPRGGRLILFTYDDTPLRSLSIRDDSYLWRFPKQQKAFFATLHLGDALERVNLWHDSGVRFSPLLGFIRRHPSIRELRLYRGSLHFASLAAGSLNTDTVNITSLSAPAIYIPYVRHAVLGIEKLEIILDAQMWHGAYVEALAAIDPAWPVHTLSLDFPYDTAFPFHTIPWREESNGSAEGRLNSVRVLEIEGFRFTIDDIEPLVRWLTRFSALLRLQVNKRRAYPSPAIHMAEPAILAQSIAEALPHF